MMNARVKWHESTAAWAFIFKRYLPRMALCSLLWELVQLPLYTLWTEAKPGRIAFAVAHCTAGDVLIGIAALLLALILSRAGRPGDWPMGRIGMLTALLAVSYTLSSERINMAQGNWTYSSWMPVLPYVEVGLSPLLQWIIVPLAALWWAQRQRCHPDSLHHEHAECGQSVCRFFAGGRRIDQVSSIGDPYPDDGAGAG